ncbi:FAD-dependent oxidoreductase [Planomonospora parontospora]|uniref:FAD-dependent oxidoreductase n=1 Tax=Planomonospora parontospora TaxID=58119 RepID=UPI00167148A2|nr:FAD-dependent oxidoreductase [Planomonospora parontospora]GGL50041.1 flavoprotein [Planomonospora parontospora subsp. antibiotica]GII19346.1 flavoprotein [Planomonospora parontospora subsp. antibiotica]
MSSGCCGPATPAEQSAQAVPAAQVIAAEQAARDEQVVLSPQLGHLPVVVIGAGPVGLAAAAHLAERGLAFLVLEAGSRVGASISQWGHVRTFSPWKYDIDPAARRLLNAHGWDAPDPDWLPTGAELVERYLDPLAAHPVIAPYLRLNAQVTGISRAGFDRVRSLGREHAPFLIRLETGGEIAARAVVDASGTWRTPNVLGASGLPARGEHAAGGFVDHALPDVLGADRDAYAGKHTLVVGAGHSAATTLLALAQLAEEVPGTRITWAIRAGSAARTYGGGAADALPARGALGTRLRALVESGRITLLTAFFTHEVSVDGESVTVISRDPSGVEQKVVADRIVAATGYRPDHAIASELRLDLDAILGSTRALAPLIDPNHHSCGTVPAHGAAELAHPEAGYYAVGVKSYGRAPTFLMATGYEQVRSVVAALAGDWAAARQVQLDLPETGVCSSNLAEAQEARVGLATGISGGLLATPLPLAGVSATTDGGGCCG